MLSLYQKQTTISNTTVVDFYLQKGGCFLLTFLMAQFLARVQLAPSSCSCSVLQGPAAMPIMLPRPLLNQNRSAVDKLLEFLTGEGPSNRWVAYVVLLQSPIGFDSEDGCVGGWVKTRSVWGVEDSAKSVGEKANAL